MPLLYRDGGPSVMESPIWGPQWAGEGNAHVRALELLRSYDGPADWFCISPPYGFGPWNPGTRTGRFRVTVNDVGDILRGNSRE